MKTMKYWSDNDYLIPIFAITFTTQNLLILINYKTAPNLWKIPTSKLEISWKPTIYKWALKATRILKLK